MVTILCGMQIVLIICSAISVKCIIKHLVVHTLKFIYSNLGTVIYCVYMYFPHEMTKVYSANGVFFAIVPKLSTLHFPPYGS